MRHEAEWQRYFQTRSEADRNRLCELYMDDAERYAGRVAKNKKLLLDREEALQTGRVALIEAVTTFNPDNKTKANFSTWLTQKIYFALIEDCRKLDFVSKDQRRRGIVAKVQPIGVDEHGRKRDLVQPAACEDVSYLPDDLPEDLAPVPVHRSIPDTSAITEEQRHRINELAEDRSQVLTERNISKIVGVPLDCVYAVRADKERNQPRKPGRPKSLAC